MTPALQGALLGGGALLMGVYLVGVVIDHWKSILAFVGRNWTPLLILPIFLGMLGSLAHVVLVPEGASRPAVAGAPVSPSPTRTWNHEDRHRGLHCLTHEVEAHDGSTIRVNMASTMIAKHYARDKAAFKIHGYQMCQANKEGWHPTWIWFRDTNAAGGTYYRIAVVRVKTETCGVPLSPVQLINNLAPEQLPPEPDWLMKIEGCSASGYVGPRQKGSQ